MDPHRFDTLTRALTTTGSRRTALATLLGGTLGLLGLADAAAKKNSGGGGGGGGKKGKGRNKKNNGGDSTGQPSAPSAATCAATCSSNCAACAYRAAGPTLCGDGYSSLACETAKVCSSDNDCTDVPGYPYCILTGEDRATGRSFGTCPDGKPRCSSIIVC